jgi:hypothetical protein
MAAGATETVAVIAPRQYGCVVSGSKSLKIQAGLSAKGFASDRAFLSFAPLRCGVNLLFC